MKLGQILLRRKVLTAEQLQDLIEQQSRTRLHLGALAIANGYISSTDLQHALCEQHWRDHGSWVID
ncbi:hypothetical protein [Rubidibacter lacunae]|uniref:hypothetical protein n=1 Tax=Rubidibacter lacunae TaxID=582514 RepID=UPI000408378C|nr:hypothetical protein [Rubidibacter lacunae]